MLIFNQYYFVYRSLLLVLSIGILLVSSKAVYAENKTITVVTEELAIGYRNKDNQKDMGVTAVFVEYLLKKMHADYKLKVLPWSRALVYSKMKPNTLIFPIARTEDRENDYIWIGKVFPADYRLYKLKIRNDVIVNNFEDVKKYRIGVKNNSITHQYLSSKEVGRLEIVNSDVQNLRKLIHHRVDLFTKTKGGMNALCKEIDFDCNKLVPALILDEVSPALYIAYSKDTDKNLIDRTKSVYKDTIGKNIYKQLISEW